MERLYYVAAVIAIGGVLTPLAISIYAESVDEAVREVNRQHAGKLCFTETRTFYTFDTAYQYANRMLADC
jgi:hypothetical protein